MLRSGRAAEDDDDEKNVISVLQRTKWLSWQPKLILY